MTKTGGMDMKQVWSCMWEVTPGKGEEILRYPTLEAAKQAMRRKITEYVDLSDFYDKLQPEAAAFLGKYLADPNFPQTREECPDIDEEWEGADGDGEILMHSGCVHLIYPDDMAPHFSTNIVLDENVDERYYLDFWYEGLWGLPSKGVSGMSVSIRSETDYGTSAYPLLVLFALREEPVSQTELISRIYMHWNTLIDRKAIGRHLKLLKDMGFPVRHNKDGYYYDGEKTAPAKDMKFTPNTYPLMVMETLDSEPKTMEAIKQEIHNRYGVEIDRKVVSRHIKLLDALGFKLEKTQGGYRMKL